LRIECTQVDPPDTDEGRVAEEWVQTDTYDFLRQLGS